MLPKDSIYDTLLPVSLGTNVSFINQFDTNASFLSCSILSSLVFLFSSSTPEIGEDETMTLKDVLEYVSHSIACSKETNRTLLS